MHISATLGHDRVVEILCKNNADINQSIIIDDQPVTAYDLALTQEKTTVCNILSMVIKLTINMKIAKNIYK